MRTRIQAAATMAIVVAIVVMGCRALPTAAPTPLPSGMWLEEFGLAERTLVTTGRNPFFILEPGFQLVLEGTTSAGTVEKLAVTVLDETKEVNGVLTRVVEEREWLDGDLREVSRNFFAIDEETKDVFYFGEEVDTIQNGDVVHHQGAWRAGKNGARAGLIMPGSPQVGAQYYQEISPGVAMDRAEVISVDATFETPAGEFTNCLRTREGSALNPEEEDWKTYAPGIGLIQDQHLRLIGYGIVTLP